MLLLRWLWPCQPSPNTEEPGKQARAWRELPCTLGLTEMHTEPLFGASHLQMPIQLHVPGDPRWIPLQQACVNAGAADNFMAAATAWALQIPLLHKSMPNTTEVIDSSPLASGPLEEETGPLGGGHYSGTPRNNSLL